MDETMTIDGIGGRFWKRFEDFWEILEADGELSGDCGNKGVAVARLSLTNPHIPAPSLENQSQHPPTIFDPSHHTQRGCKGASFS